jgi:hypothetical protein
MDGDEWQALEDGWPQDADDSLDRLRATGFQ